MTLFRSTVVLFGVFAFALAASTHHFPDEDDSAQHEILQLLRNQGATLDNIQQQSFGKEVKEEGRAASLIDAVVGQQCLFVDSRLKSTGIFKAVSLNIQCDKLENVAPGKTTSSISVYQGRGSRKHPSQNAIDDDDDSTYHSEEEPFPWWMIDLGSQKTIYAIMIHTRQDCCSRRFHDVEIRLGNTLVTDGAFGTHKLLTFYKGPYSKDQGTLMYAFPNGVTGQYLSIKIDKQDDQNILQLNDVKIMALIRN